MSKTKQIPPFGLRMPSELKKWLTEQAHRQNRSMNNLIVCLLNDARTAAEPAEQK